MIDVEEDEATPADCVTTQTVSANWTSQCALVGDQVACWGGSWGYGELGRPAASSTFNDPGYVVDEQGDPLVATQLLESLYRGGCALAGDGLYCWGASYHMSPFTSDYARRYDDLEGIVDFTSGQWPVYCARTDEGVFCQGRTRLAGGYHYSGWERIDLEALASP